MQAILQRHFSVQTLAELWNVSEDTVRRWFEDEPGVFKLGTLGGRGKHRKISLRIPENIAERVYREKAKWTLTVYRRHSADCPHKGEPSHVVNKCKCPLWARGRVRNQHVRRSLDAVSYDRACRRADELEAELESGRVKMSVSAAVMQFLDCKVKDVRNSSLKRYRRTLQPLVDFSEKNSIADISAFDLCNLDSFKLSRNLSALTWSKELGTIRAFFRHAQKRKWTDTNPAAEMRAPRNPKSKERKPYFDEELLRITAASTFGRSTYERSRARAMVLLMLRYALRISDVATLRRDRIRDGYIYLHAFKNGNPIWVPLYEDVAAALDAVPLTRGAAPTCPYFFWTGQSDVDWHVRTVNRTMQAVFKESGVEQASNHRFRHTLAVKILVNGGTIEDAANVLGDSPAVVRKHYLPWCKQFQHRIIATLDKVHRKGCWYVRGTREKRLQ